MKRLLGRLAFAATLFATVAPVTQAEVFVAPKHLIILRQGLDSIWGSYVFAVQNTDEQPAHLKTKIMLPKEVEDFAPQEGVTAEQVRLAPEGGVEVEKDFEKGVGIVSIGWKARAAFGHATLTIKPTTDVNNFTILVPRDSGMAVGSRLMAPGELGGSKDPQFEALQNTEPLKAGTEYVFEISGLPEGRTRLWIVGAGVGASLLLLAGLLAFRTRPKITGDAGGALLTG